MDARDKAYDLCERFKTECMAIQYEPVTPIQEVEDVAKQCALICVDEILKGDHLLRLPLSYWQKVKTEIENL